MKEWLFLAGAIASEVAGTTSMKLCDGFTKLVPSLLVVVCYGVAFTLLGFALKTIDVSVAYAIWAGVGTALICVVGMLFFREGMSLLKLLSIALIVVGVVGLNLGGVKH